MSDELTKIIKGVKIIQRIAAYVEEYLKIHINHALKGSKL